MTLRLQIAALASVAALAAVGCGTKPNPDAEGLKCQSEICPVKIAIKAPGPMTYTNADLMIEVTVTPPSHGPAEIQLFKDGARLATLTDSLSYTWKTAQEREDTYHIRASATINGQTVMSETITVVVDRTAPTMQVQPTAGASNVALSDPIQITFSEPVDPGTVPSTAITLKDSAGVSLAAASTLSADGRTLTVTDWNRAALASRFPATITESIAGTIADRAGNVLVPPAPWTWTAPLWVKLPSLLGRAPSLAVDGAGQPTISYTKPDPANPSSGVGPLGIARYATGSTWDLTLGAPTSGFAAGAIAIGPTGEPVVAWAEQNHVRAARLSGATWQSIGGDADSGLPSAPMAVSSMALDASGNPTVGIWDYVSQMGPPSGYVARWSGAAWQLLTPSNMPFGTNSGGPLVRIDSAAQPTVWSSGSLQRFVGVNWLTIDTAMPNSGAYATLDLDAQDRPVLAFQTASGGTTYLDVRVFDANTWRPFAPSVSNAVGGFSEVQVAVASDGNPVVVWKQGGVGAPPDLHVARYDGQGWRADFGVLNAVSGSAPGRAQLALDPLGAPVVAWEEYDPATLTTSVYVWKSNL